MSRAGTGKTHTIRAVVARAAGGLFRSGPTEVRARCVELRAQGCFDLLGDRAVVEVNEDAAGDVHLRGASVHSATSEAALAALLEEAMESRATGSTARNDASSRSHAVLKLEVIQFGYEPPGGGSP